MGGEGDDGDARARSFRFANGARGGEAVEFRHLNIHEDEVWIFGVPEVERDAAVSGRDDRVAVVFEHTADDGEIDLVVFGNEDPEGADGMEGSLWSDGNRGGGGELERELEAAATAEVAGDGEVAAHGGDDAGGDGEAEPGAAVATGDGGIGLLEGLEDGLYLGGRNANAGVLNFECHGVAGSEGTQCDGADGSELDGVGEEVVNDLAEAGWIAVGPGGAGGGEVDGEAESLFVGADREEAVRGGKHGGDGEGGAFEVEFTGVEFGEIEDVVEKAEEIVSGLSGGGETFGGNGVFCGAGGEFDHAKDTVHRCSDLVADVGEELSLGAVGLFGGFFGRAQFGRLAMDAGA